MSSPEEVSGEQPLEPKQHSLARSSLVMASGTLVSRVLGFLRNAMLIAAIGVGLGAADAFQAANTLPNSVYNLLAAGVFNAVLIPQIVRALKKKGGIVYVNRLITLAATILFAITVLAMVGAPILISVTSSGFPPEVRTLAITFAIWCLPQLFFYGLYNLWGEVLNARGIFGPYMWAPVVSNVVAIAGLGYFIYLWGPSAGVFPAEQITGVQILVLAGTATLGVVFQALVLLLPLRRSGVKLRPDFNFRGTDFGSASKVAGWTFATLLVSQLGVLSTTNIASKAVAWGAENGELVASLPAYNTAFMIYMVPQSLISVTLATAIFTRLALNVADGDFKAVAYNYHTALRMIMLLTMVSAAVIIAAAVPLMQLIMPTFTGAEASLYANVLVALMLGVPSTGIVLISQRVFYAFENARPVFLMGLIPTALQLIIGWSIFFLADAQWWTVGAAAAETACRILQGFIAIFWAAHFVRTINAGRMVRYYLTYFTAFAVSAFAGWLVLHFVSPSSSNTSVAGRFADALWKCVITLIVVVVVYFLVLKLIDPKGSQLMRSFVESRLPARFRRDGNQPSQLDAATESAVETEEAMASNLGPGEALTSPLPLANIWAMRLADEQPTGGSVPGTEPDTPAAGINVGDRLAAEAASRSVASALGISDPTPTGQIPVLRSGPFIGEVPETRPSFDDIITGNSDPDSPKLEGGDAAPTPAEPIREDVILMDDSPVDPTSTPNPPADNGSAAAGSVNVPTPPPVSTGGGSGAGDQIVSREAISGDSGAPAKRGFDPTVPTLILAGLLVVLGIIYAFSVLRGPSPGGLELPTTGGASQSAGQSSQSEETPAPAPTPDPAPTTVAPVIGSLEIFSWGDDGKDHPELVDALIDGDAATFWYTRYYDWNQFSEDSMISILINLEEETVVTSVTIDIIGSGGEVTIRDASGGNPRAGTVLGTSTLQSTTVIKLDEPTRLSSLGLNFVTLPTDDEGLNRAKVTGISVQ